LQLPSLRRGRRERVDKRSPNQRLGGWVNPADIYAGKSPITPATENSPFKALQTPIETISKHPQTVSKRLRKEHRQHRKNRSGAKNRSFLFIRWTCINLFFLIVNSKWPASARRTKWIKRIFNRRGNKWRQCPFYQGSGDIRPGSRPKKMQ